MLDKVIIKGEIRLWKYDEYAMKDRLGHVVYSLSIYYINILENMQWGSFSITVRRYTFSYALGKEKKPVWI